MNIGIIGAGAIATYLLKEIRCDKSLNVKSILIRDYKKYMHLEKEYNLTLYTDFDKFVTSKMDIIIEAADVTTTTKLLPELIKKNDVISISIGALADELFLTKIKQKLELYGHRLYLPSGAIGGLDLVQNLNSVGLLSEVSLVTRKPAYTLTNEKLTEEKVVFQGIAAESIKKYHKNINVSIALALAGVGLEQTKVTLIADPNVSENTHSINIASETGKANFTISNKPLPTNPNTSYLAAVSIMGVLEKIRQNIKIG